MKEQTAAYLEKARELLGQAETIFGVRLYEPAGRTAYLAGFHAAQALIFETSGRIYNCLYIRVSSPKGQKTDSQRAELMALMRQRRCKCKVEMTPPV